MMPPNVHSYALTTLGSFWNFPIFPDSASTVSGRVDAVYLALVGASAFLTLAVCAVLIYFSIKYRAGSKVDRRNPFTQKLRYELLWVGVPMVLLTGVFFWAARVYYTIAAAPADTLDIYVVGKQWMWKMQHPNGRREINELHLPLGRNVRVVLTSQDVIHSFFVPAFRTKMDALPDRYTYAWFTPTRLGEYHLFCAEYCGADHSRMTGKVVVMTASDYEKWLTQGGSDQSMVAAGQAPFTSLGCANCHVTGSDARAPRLEGLFGRQIKLADGTTLTANENYIRESILNPASQIVAGYQPIMPTFRGQVSAEQLAQLVEYVKSLGQEDSSPAATLPADAPTPGETP